MSLKISPKHIIPNALTFANVICGFFSLVYSSEGDLLWAGLFIALGSVVDFMDGLSARLLKASTEFGKQLDSLSDMVTFGLAPSFLFYQFIVNTNPSWLKVMSVFIAIGAASRLAKFNIDPRQKKGFVGLPTPAVGLLIASIPFIYEFEGLELGLLLQHPVFQFMLPVISCILMISGFRLFSLKFERFSLQGNKIRYAFLILSAGFIAVFHFTGIPMIILAYLILSLIHNFAQ